MQFAVSIKQLSHHYGNRIALDQVSLEILPGEIFGVLGPNGSGKSTLFRLLSTLLPLQQGEVSLAAFDLAKQPSEIRRRIGVVFQTSSLDKKLTVRENIRYQAALYGVVGQELARREGELLEQFGLRERANDLCERLSGGLRRRVELAKSIIHHPQLLLLDEPSTGLDPGARLDLWQCLTRMRAERQVTVILTTHLLDEAAKADRLAIFDQGKLVALDSPAALQATVGGDAITIRCAEPASLAAEITERWQLPAVASEETVRVEVREGHQWIARLVEAWPGRVQEITLGKPTLEDVFIAKTGHRFADQREAAA